MSTESYRAGNTALLEALMDMVLQHCCSPVDDLIRHRYISSNEAAVAILEKAGMVKDDKLDWAALEARKATPTPPAALSPAPADAGEPVAFKRSQFRNGWTTFNVRDEHADEAERRLLGEAARKALQENSDGR